MKIILLFLTGLIAVPLHSQITRKNKYDPISNQWNNKYYNGIDIKMGMAKKFLFSNLPNDLIQNINFPSNGLNNSGIIDTYRKSDLNSSVGYSTFNGLSIGQGWKRNNSTAKRISKFSFILNGDLLSENMESTSFFKKTAGAELNGFWRKRGKKYTLSFNSLLKSGLRNYQFSDIDSSTYKLNQHFFAFKTYYTKKLSTNRHFKVLVNNQFYKGNTAFNEHTYKGLQFFNGLDMSYVRIRKRISSNWGIAYNNLYNYEKVAQIKHQFEIKNTLIYKFGKKNDYLKNNMVFRNSIAFLGKNQWEYLPFLQLNFVKNKKKLNLRIGRSQQTFFNTQELWVNPKGIHLGYSPITTDNVGIGVRFKKSKIVFNPDISFQKFHNYIINNQSFDNLLTAKFKLSKYKSNGINYMAEYKFKRSGFSTLNLIPAHSANINISYKYRYSYIYSYSHSYHAFRYLNVGISSNYRSSYHSSLTSKNDSKIKGNIYFNLFSDFTLKKNSKTKFHFKISNLLGTNSLTSSQQQNYLLLYTDGLRNAQSVEFGVKFKI